MGVLNSKLFTDGDQATVKKLEDCATGQPNEAQSHFTIGQSGEHIKKVQEALKSVQEGNPGLGIPEFSVNGVYDQRFANAIRIYKTKRDIRNFANKIDDIVGVKTIRSLDKENKSGPPKVNPSPSPTLRKSGEFPRPLPNCVPDSDCPSSREFDVTLLAGVSGGEVVEIGKFFFTIRDTTNGLSTIYILRVGGFGAGASPISVAGGGGKKHFTTSQPVRVTRFGPFGSIGSATNKPAIPVSGALLVLGFHPDGLRVPRLTPPMTIDTGPIEIPGANIHAGQLKILSLCNGQPGATRRVLGINDVPS
jgi:hypothetical protein